MCRRAPDGCPNCSQDLEAFLQKLGDWRVRFYNDNSGLSADALAALNFGQAQPNMADIDVFVDRYMRQKMTNDYLVTFGAFQ